MAEKPDHGQQKVIIHIDHKKYETDQEIMTGTQIRSLAVPPISEDYDLFLETHGPGDDRKIADEEEVALSNGMHFYSVLRQINPGASDATA
jgi:hypothetical protein